MTYIVWKEPFNCN